MKVPVLPVAVLLVAVVGAVSAGVVSARTRDTTGFEAPDYLLTTAVYVVPTVGSGREANSR
jgi:hypothetical protein